MGSGPGRAGSGYLRPAAADQGATGQPGPVHTFHQLSTVGIEVDRVTDRITARPPLPHEADILGIEPGVAVIVMHKLSVDTTGRVVEVADAIWAGDRTELVYNTKLKRWKR